MKLGAVKSPANPPVSRPILHQVSNKFVKWWATISHFKQAKTEVNSGQTTKSGGDFEDLVKVYSFCIQKSQGFDDGVIIKIVVFAESKAL